MKISFIYMNCLFFMMIVTFVLCMDVSFGQNADNRVPADRFYFKHFTCHHQYSQNGKDIFRWTLEEQKDKSENPVKHFWVVTRICMNNQEKKVFKFPYEIQEKDLKRKGSLNTNFVNVARLIVSSNGEFFIIREFGGKNMLICSETGKEIVFNKVRKSYFGGEETALGFNTSGDLFCGMPCLSPMLVLREINMKTKTVEEGHKEEYRHRKMSYFPKHGLQPEYWLDWDTSYDNIGILYSVLPPPEENSDSKTIVLPFTTFQFQFLMAMIVIYDSKTGFNSTQTFVDTTRWFEREKVFFWSIDGRYLAIHDGPQKLQIYDTKTRNINVCDILTQSKDDFDYIRKAWFLSNGEIAIVIAEKYQCLFRSVIWSPQTRKFRELFSNSTVLSVSPKGDYIATATIKQPFSLNNILFRRPEIDIADTIEFLTTKDNKKIHTLPLKFTSRVYFASDWSLFELNPFDYNGVAMSPEVIDLSKILPLQNSADSPVQFELREWNSTVGTKTNAKYVSATETAVKLEKEDGKIITVPLAKLSQEDQEYVKQLIEDDEKNK